MMMLLPVLICVMCISASAQTPVIISEQQDQYALGPFLEYLEDKSGLLIIDDVSSPAYTEKFVPSRKQALNLGHTESAIWVRFRVKNASGVENKYILELGFQYMQHVSCFRSRSGQAGFDTTHTGIFHPLSTREFPYHRFVFALRLLPGEEQTVYLRCKTESSMTIPLTLLSSDAFTRRSHLTLLFAGVFYGGLVMMICYNAFLCIALRDRSYIYFTAFLINIGMTQICYEGFAAQYLVPDSMLFNRFAANFFAGFLPITSILFFIEFLNTRRNTPVLHIVLTAMLVLRMMMIVLLPFISFTAFAKSGHILRVILNPILLLTAFLVWRRGYRPAGYVTLAWAAVIIPNFMMSLVRLGMIPSNLFTEHGYQAGALMMIILLSLALADRISLIREEMKKAEKKYRSLFENAVEGIFQSVPGKGYLSVNSAYAKIFGYDSPQEVLSSVSDVGKQMYVNPEDREKLVEIIRQNGRAEGFEAQLYRKDRSVIWVSVYARNVCDNQGNLLYYEGSFIDITDRKQAEFELRKHQEHLEELVKQRTEQLTEANEYLENVIENSADVIAMTDRHGKFVKWNKTAAEVFGYSFEELKNKSVFEIYPDREELEGMLTRLRYSGVIRRYEIRMQKKDGTVFPAENSVSILKNVSGETIGSVAVVRNVSDLKNALTEIEAANRKLSSEIRERRKAEAELRQAYSYLENVIENSPDCISISDRQGKVFKWNRMASELSGYSFDEIRKISVYDVYADRDEFEAVKKKLREQGVVSRHEIKMRRKDGAVFPVEASIAVLKDEHRKPVATIAIVSDLSEIKKALTEARIAREAAEQANKKITDSINYAKMIQRSLLANLDVVKTYIPNSFFIWESKDIVGGDIFFTEKLEDGFIVAVADCTGHGVPGAFMTMIAVSALRRIIKDEECRDPAEILKRLNVIVKTTLHQDKVYALSDDGMDVGIVRMENVSIESHAFGFQSSELIFAGAKIPLYYVRRGEINVIKGDRESIGYRRSDVNFSFTNYRIHIEKGMNFYMASDGFSDQLGGGEKRRRFGTARFRNLLKEISGEPFEKQRSMLIQAFEEHRGDNDRQDDMTVAGFGFK